MLHPLLVVSTLLSILFGVVLGVVRATRASGAPVSWLVAALALPTAVATWGAYQSTVAGDEGVGFVPFALGAALVTVVLFFLALAVGLLAALPFRRRLIERPRAHKE